LYWNFEKKKKTTEKVENLWMMPQFCHDAPIFVIFFNKLKKGRHFWKVGATSTGSFFLNFLKIYSANRRRISTRGFVEKG
jgi:hypothetical protein